MRHRFINKLKLYGPFLINRDKQRWVINDNSIVSETGIYAEKLTKKSKYSLEALALGENNKEVCVFCTPKKPDIDEVMQGLDKYVGWSDKNLPIQKVFELSNGKVTTHDAELIEHKFPDAYKDLKDQENASNKKS